MTVVFTYLKAAAMRKVINLPMLGKKKKNIIKQHRLELQRGRLSLYISKTKNKKHCLWKLKFPSLKVFESELCDFPIDK